MCVCVYALLCVYIRIHTYICFSAVPSVASNGVDITFYDLTEQEVLAEYSSVENFVDNFCQVISMVNPDVTLLSWRSDPPQGESLRYINRHQVMLFIDLSHL